MASTREVVFQAGDRSLRGMLFDPRSSASSGAALMFVHGLGSSQTAYASRAEAASQALGVQCLTLDLSGHGDDKANSAQYSVYQHLEDVIASYDYLAALETTDPARIGGCGASYGAYLTALLSADRSLERLLLRAPALASNVDFPASSSPFTSSELRDEPEAFDSLAVLSRYTGEVLVLESELDERIPHSQIVAYLRACRRSEHEVIPGATHALTAPVWNEAFVHD